MQFEDLEGYGYDLPPKLIRREGIEPRDSARLFVYDTATDTIRHDFFFNLAGHLPERSLMILNETRVVPARLWLRKETGGKIETFVLVNEWDGGSEIPLIVDRKCAVGQNLLFPNGDRFVVVRQEGNRFFAHLKLKQSHLVASPLSDSLFELLDRYGETPVPHYLEEDELLKQVQDDKVERERKLRKRYQTIFAKTGASVAAPTASLHFTDRVFESLDAKGIDIAKVTLDVGQGTFAPLREENFATKQLHCERIEVSEETARKVNEVLGSQASKSGRRSIVAVGTTALRTLESVTQRSNPVTQFSGTTDLFIYPPHTFRSADILVTNFHLPKTSLMLLVDAFLGYKGAKRRILPLYEEAIRKSYAFYSFGDSMLIL